jgi:16S rRNA (guanine527-N7)-methyltransferase
MTPPAADPGTDRIEAVPAAAATIFGSSLPAAGRYAEVLASTGVERGLIGPREAGRIWSRHLLNCAVVEELVPRDDRIVDVGSGAGLPGIALALARPDLQITLIEPLLRRSEFLAEAVAELDLGGRVRVVRGRAEDRDIRAVAGNSPIVVARAVAPIDRMVRWCLPLLVPGGWLLALKGVSAGDELRTHAAAVRRAGGVSAEVVSCGQGLVDPPPAVIRVQRRTKGSDFR